MKKHAIITSAIGTIFILAGAFELLTPKIAIFLGVVCYFIAGVLYATASK